jgi:C-terminal peptidase prc
MEDDQVVVIAPFEDSPAARAGIRSGDIIVTIDGVPVNSTTLDDTIGRMRGTEGTQVKIGILRQGNLEPLIFTLKRSKVELHSVKSQLLEPGIGYTRISQFSETTGDELNAALKELRKHNNAPLKGLVLDMRDNPGGVLEAAVAVADAFIDSGVIVTAKGRTPDSKFEMDATPGDALNGAPIVVLVNGGSASAAEIVAGALKDQHRAKLMGHTTFGKGSVQTIMPLSDDRAIKLTTSLYYTPSGVSINHRGIAPDIELPREAKARDAAGGRNAGAARCRGAARGSGIESLAEYPHWDCNHRSTILSEHMGSTRSIEILCLVLAALVMLWSRALALEPLAGCRCLMGAFAVAIVLFRARVFFPTRSRVRLVVESWTMVAFITGVLWLSGKAASPLLNLYLLPVILSA